MYFGWKNHRSAAEFVLVHPTGVGVGDGAMTRFGQPVGINFDHLIKMVSSRFLCCKVTFPFSI